MELSFSLSNIDNYTQIEYSEFMDIKKLREQTKLSQSQFAKKYNIPLRTLQKWEQHAAEPSSYLMDFINQIIDFANFVDVDKYRLNPRTTFNVFVDKNYKNVNKIHPIMQKDVGIILNELQKYSEVKRIIVFGSSITDRCTYESDIDIYVELSENKNVKTYDVMTPVDYWNNFTVDKNMLEEILDKGVVIYDCK